MTTAERVLQILKEKDGFVRISDLRSLDVHPQTLYRVIGKLLNEGLIERGIRITDRGQACRATRQRKTCPELSMLIHPPQETFKAISDEAIEDLRNEAVEARQFR